MYYYVKEDPTELYHERHQLLVGQIHSARLARKALKEEKAQAKSMSSRAARGALGLFVVALIMVGIVLVGASGPADASTTSTVNTTADIPDAIPPSGTSANSEQGETPNPSRLLQKAEREGSVRVIVRLSTDFVPEGRLDRTEVVDQRDGIESAQAALQENLQGTAYQTLRE